MTPWVEKIPNTFLVDYHKVEKAPTKLWPHSLSMEALLVPDLAKIILLAYTARFEEIPRSCNLWWGQNAGYRSQPSRKCIFLGLHFAVEASMCMLLGLALAEIAQSVPLGEACMLMAVDQ